MITDNITEVLNGFDKESVRSIMLSALEKGGKWIVERTKENISAAPFKKNDKMLKKVRVYRDKTTEEVVTSIYGYYLLRWFEKGTAERFTKSGASRGSIKPYNFFQSAKDRASEIMDKVLSELQSQIDKKLK